MLTLSKKINATPVSAVDYCNRAIALKKNIETTFLVLGEMLKEIRDKKLYDGSYTDFDEFCAEMDFTESRASKLITVYVFFVSLLNIPEEKLMQACGWSNLYEVYQLADGKNEAEQKTFVEETLDILSSPILGGRQKLLRAMKKGIDTISCTHADSYLISCCRACGERIRQYPEGTTILHNA